MPEESISVGFYEDDLEDRTRRYFGEDNLERIKKSTILCVGAGAVGNEVCKNLGMLDINKFTTNYKFSSFIRLSKDLKKKKIWFPMVNK